MREGKQKLFDRVPARGSNSNKIHGSEKRVSL